MKIYNVIRICSYGSNLIASYQTEELAKEAIEYLISLYNDPAQRFIIDPIIVLNEVKKLI